MANELSITVGVGTVSIPVKGTITQIRSGLRRFVISQGYSVVDKTDAQIGRMALWLMMNWVKEESDSLQQQESLEVEKARIAAMTAIDNDLLGPLPE